MLAGNGPLFPVMAAGERVMERACKGDGSHKFCNLITEATSQDPLLLAPSVSPGQPHSQGGAHTRHEHQGVGAVGTILESAFHVEGNIEDSSKQRSKQENSRKS